MGDLLNRAEHYRKRAVKYHELAKFAQPPYLGDFYRGVAVRYIFMAQELSKRAEDESGFAAGLPPAAACDGEDAGRVEQDLELLTVWAGERLTSGESK